MSESEQAVKLMIDCESGEAEYVPISAEDEEAIAEIAAHTWAYNAALAAEREKP